MENEAQKRAMNYRNEQKEKATLSTSLNFDLTQQLQGLSRRSKLAIILYNSEGGEVFASHRPTYCQLLNSQKKSCKACPFYSSQKEHESFCTCKAGISFKNFSIGSSWQVYIGLQRTAHFNQSTISNIAKETGVSYKQLFDSYLSIDKKDSLVFEEALNLMEFGIENCFKSQTTSYPKEMGKTKDSYFQVSQKAICILVNRKIKYLNPIGLALFNSNSKNILNQELNSFMDADDQEMFTTALVKVETGQQMKVDIRVGFNLRQERAIYHLSMEQFNYDAQKAVLCYMEPSLLNNEVLGTNALLQDIVDSGETFIVRINTKGVIEYANKQVKDFYKKIGSPIIGQKISTIKTFYTSKQSRATLKEYITDQKKHTFDYSICKDGETHWIRTFIIPLFNHKKEAIGTLLQSYHIDEEKEIEIALRESEQMYRELTNLGDNFIITVNRGRQISYANRHCCETLGRSLDEMMNEQISSFVFANDVVPFNKGLQKSLEGIHNECEHRIIERNGEIIWIQTTFTPRFDSSNHIAGALLQGVNITQRKNTELRLKASEQKYRELSNSGETLIMKIDTNLQCTYANDKFCELLHYKPEDFYGKKPSEFPELVNSEEYEERLLQVLENKEPINLICKVVLTNGKHCYLKSSLTPLFSENGAIKGILKQSVDITEQHEIELALINSESQFKDLANIGDIQVYVLNTQGYITYINKPAEHLYSQNIVGLHYKQITDEIEIKHWNLLYKTHEIQVFDHKKSYDDGRITWHETHYLPRYNHKKEFIGAIAQCIDITQAKNNALQLANSAIEYKELANSGEIFVLKYDTNRRYTFANKLVLEFWDLKEEEIIGKTLSEVFNIPESRAFINAFTNHERCVIELQHKKEEVNYYFRCFFTPLYDEEHHFKGMLEQLINITEQREAEEKLKESENRYKFLANSGEAIIIAFGVDKRAIYVNKQICEYTGYKEQEILGEYVDFVLSPDEAQVPEFGDLFVHPRSQSFQIQVPKKNGEKHWFRCMCSPLINNHIFSGLLVQALDVNEQIVNEQKVKKSEENYRILANSGESIILVFNNERRCNFVNNTFVQLINSSEEEVIGHEFAQYTDCDAQLLSQFNALFTWPRRIEFESKIKCSKQQSVWFRCLCTPLYEKDQFNGIMLQGYNINKRKMAEIALERSEKKYRDLANSGETFVWLSDEDNTINYANQQLSEFSNVPLALIVGSKTPMRFIPEDSARIHQELAKMRETQQRTILDFRSYRADESIRWIRAVITPKFKNDNQYIGYIGQAYDVTEQKKMQLQLIQSEERYRNLANSGDTLIVQIDQNFKIKFINQRALTFLGKRKEELNGDWKQIQFHPDDVKCLKEMMKLSVDNRTNQMFDIRVRSFNGTYHWIQISSTPQMGDNNQVEYLLLHGTDFTDRKMAEMALAESEQNYRELANSGETYVIIIDNNFKCSYINRQVMEFTGKNESEIIGQEVGTFILASDAADQIQQREKLKDNKNFITENKILRHDGEYRWIRSACSVRYNTHHENIGYIIHSSDITDSKEAELAIVESERSYRELANSGETFVIIYNEEFICTYINRQVEEFTGIDSSVFIGHKSVLPIHGDDMKQFVSIFHEHYQSKAPFIYECRIKRYDGEYRWIRINTTPRFNTKNEFIGFITHNIDIHERRMAELQIEQQRDYFYNLINAGEAFIFVFNLEGELTYINEPMLHYLNIDSESAIKQKNLNSYFLFHSDNLSAGDLLKAIKNGETIVHEQQLMNGLTGEYRWFRFVNSPYYNNEKRLTNWMVQAIDIDTVKKNEEAIRLSEQKVRASEEYYRMLSNAGDTLVWVCDENNKCTYVNDPWVDFTGKTMEDIQREGFHSVLHPDDQEYEIMHYKNDFTKHKQIVSIKRFYHVVCGHYHWIRTLATPLFNDKGAFTGYIGHCTDISEMIDSEISLQNSEKRFREIFESLQDVFFSMDVGGVILEISPSIKSLIGNDKNVDQLIGTNLKDYPEWINTKELNNAIAQTVIEGSINDSEIVIHHKTGEEIVCSFWSQCYRNTSGEPERIVGTLRNITNRKRAEKELKEQKLLYSSVMQYLPADAFRKDYEGRFLYMNQRMCQRLGVTESDVIGYTSDEVREKQLELINQNKLSDTCTLLVPYSYQKEHQQIIDKGITIDQETKYALVNGDTKYYHSIKLPVYNAEGFIIGTQGFELDITDEKLNILAIKETNNNLEIAIQKANTATELYDLAPSGYFIMNKLGIIKEVNIAASQFTGKGHEELLGHLLSDFLDSNSNDELKSFLNRMNLLPNNQITCELIFTKGDGKINAKAQGVYSEQSTDYLITLVDISDLRQTEESLRQEQQLLAKTEQLSKIGSWRWELSNRHILYSNEFGELLGYPIQEVQERIGTIFNTKKPIPGLIDETSKKTINTFIDQIHRHEVPCSCEFKYQSKNKENHWFYTECQGQYDEENNLVSLIGFLNDITQRKEAELAIKESEQRYQDILTVSPDGIVIINQEGDITDISPMAAKMLSYKYENTLKSIFNLLDEKEVVHMKSMIDQSWNSTKLEIGEFTLNNDSEIIICEITAKSVQFNNSSSKRILLNIRNITDRKLMTQKLIRSEKLVSLGEMATAMAHEINQPLLSISLSLDNLIEKINHVAPEQSEYIHTKGERIFSDISRIGRLIDHVRAFSRDKSYDNDVISSEFDIKESIDNALIIVSEQLKQHGIMVSTEFGEVKYLVGNTYRFEQVILNLLTNAKDALETKQKIAGDGYRKKINIKTYCDETNNFIEITDNGTGIKANMVKEVLKPFFTTKESHGVGVGLAISYGIVKDLDGKMDIISDGESYTTFKLTIPIPISKSKKI